MDPFAILLIIVFIVAPLIERLLKAGKGAEQPPEQRPQQRVPQQRPPQPFPQRQPQQRRPEPGATSEDDAGDDAAAAMLPDDLWEILTGERRSPQLPVPPQEPDESEEDYDVDEYADEERSLEEMGALEGPSPGEWISQRPEEAPVVVPHEPYVRPIPVRHVSKVVSLEELEFDPERRHDEFHDRLDELGGPARVRRPKPNPYRFTSDEDLRRAIVMNEILGTPKGLE